MARENNENRIRVLMVGPGRTVKGGISTVVNSYYGLGLDERIQLRYIDSMEDGNKLKKIVIAAFAYIRFCFLLSRFDIVHIHMAAQASFTRKSLFIKKAKSKRKKIIIHQHAADFDEFFLKQSGNKRRQYIKDIFLMADKVIVLSEEWELFFGTNICDKNKIIVLHNSVTLPNYNRKNYNDNNVLFLGKLGKRKGSYDLLKGIPEVLEHCPDAVFYFGGDGEIEESQRIIERMGLTEKCILLGWINGDEKETYMRKCSIFILPSYHEGMPMAVLEAMSYGMATISTNVGGIPQIIQNQINGICIKAGDMTAIVSSLTELLSDVQRKKSLGQAGRETIQDRFNMENNISKLEKIYRELEYGI